MCGIAGVVSKDPRYRSDALLRAMLARIAHRGPDDEGLENLGDAVIGARRLSIIDLAGGHQPLYGENSRIVAVQNGEIYNFRELRSELQALGHRFKTGTDTEILPHAYEQWGERFVERLRGMFAFAIWDDERRTLLLGRDRFGKKPLCYARVGDTLLFASELQALLAHPLVDRRLDVAAIDDYLTLGYVPAPQSAFRDVRKLPPGHLLVFRDGVERLERYWSPKFTPKLDISLEEATVEVRRRMEAAVRARLVSDVPLGAFLSGGLDSSAVVALMARHSDRPVKTFSIGFRSQAFDELPFARIVARAFGTEHHEFIVDAEQTDALPMLVRHLGEPFADSSIVPTYHVARLTRDHVTVALNGDGGDELFAGYDRYRAAALAQAVGRRLPGPAVTAAARLAALLPSSSAMPRSLQRLRRFALAMAMSPERRHLQWTGYFVGDLRRRIVGDALSGVDSQATYDRLDRAVAVSGAVDVADQYMASDVLSYLPDDLLVKVDIASMACSLEARSPLLDHELAEFVFRLPVAYKVSPSTTKVLMRRAIRGLVPDEIVDRRRKMGFTAPVGAWLRGPLRPMFLEAMGSSRAAAAGLITVDGVRGLYEEHAAGKADRTMQLWNLLMLEFWFRECVEGVTPARQDAPATISG